jgi:hypothetical protein
VEEFLEGADEGAERLELEGVRIVADGLEDGSAEDGDDSEGTRRADEVLEEDGLEFD